MAETIQEVTGKTAGEYFARLDALVAPGTVLYVYGGAAVALAAVRESVSRLPATFRDDALVRENLDNLERDMKMWGIGRC